MIRCTCLGAEGDIIWDGLVMDITELKQAQTERDRFFTISLDLLCIARFRRLFQTFKPRLVKCSGLQQHAELLAQPTVSILFIQTIERRP